MSRVELPVMPSISSTGSQEVDVAGFQAALAATITGELRFDRLSRALYSTDASVYQIVPLGVVIPKTGKDIIATVRACARFRVPLTARGGGTSQAGQAIGPGLQLDCSKYFNRILELNAEERWVRVQPGCVLDDLNLAVKPLGLYFPHDISTSNRATLGGMIANNSSGARSVLYGKTGDHVEELKVVLADGSVVVLGPLDNEALERKCAQPDLEGAGYRQVRHLAREYADEIDRRYPKILRRVGGYNLDRFRPRLQPDALLPKPFNLAHLFVGSEGTLGITLEAKLHLVELPRARALLVVQFADLLEALAATPVILEHRPSAVEVVDEYVLDSTRLNPEASRLRDFLQGDPQAILLIEFFGQRAEELSARLEALEADLRRRGLGYHCHRAIESAAQARIWKLRKAALGLSMAEKGDAKAISFVEDTAVAPERLRAYIADFLALIARHGTRAGIYAHASVGCLHVRPVINLKTVEGVQRFAAIAEEVADLVLKYGGALSGEHGDGLVRSPFQEKMFGPALYQAFRDIKQTFDPLHILNPGKIVDAPPLTANLRYGPAYVTPDLPTTFDFSVDGGLTRATELCAGVGECRKKREGTMCPSYQATRDEQHSTRGRANALRLAITGQLGDGGFTDPALFEVLDLCLECKACKSECPTNVDMARLKAEYLDQYYRKHGLPWRNWLFGNVASLSRRGGRWGNWWLRSWLGRWLNEKLLGIDRRRMPPVLATKSFWKGSSEPFEKGADSRGFPVILFVDTFTNLFEPHLGRQTAEVLSHAGCRVFPGMDIQSTRLGAIPVALPCCGRPYISNGMLSRAVALAQHNVERLHQWAVQGIPIIACEPSCILTIKDDYPALLQDESRQQAEVVAAKCRTLESFLESILAMGERRLSFRPGPKKILVQGHCHQRSLIGMEPTLRLLRRIPGAEVIDLDAGCCGMAGSFGYEKEHYEVSRLVGEQRLFPALREAEPDAVVVASGFSCRMQIQHFTGRKAVHPVELLHSLLAEPGAP